jgi:ribosomal protein L11 methylase PrmA
VLKKKLSNMAHITHYNTVRTLVESTRNLSISLIENTCKELGKSEEAERLVALLVDDTVRVKKFKDKNAPKKPMNAYMIYCNEHRAEVKASLGEKADFKSIVQKLSADWKLLGDKSKYEKLAEEDKERFAVEEEKYKEALYSN